MLRSRLAVAAVVIGSVLALDAGVAGAADPTYPTGTFAVPHTTVYIHTGDGESPGVAFVPVTRLGLADDSTPAAQLSVVLHPDEGAAGQAWPWNANYATHDIVYGGGDIDDPQPWPDIAGTHHPYVTITDADGHTTRVDLPTVTIREDNTPPVARVTMPKRHARHTIHAWRFIHGTTTDAGVGTDETYVLVMQKRHGRYWVYNGTSKEWHRGLRTAAATLHSIRTNVDLDLVDPAAAHWRTRYIHGVTRGRLVVWMQGMDSDLNMGAPKVGASITLTRRR